ncbi:MAG TPA: hypothetical protein VFA78_01055, partial [Chloroflexota bacterium]|nr:hypothetical protein [Chloroflexota bacterium]
MRRATVWWIAAAIYVVQALRLRNHASSLRLVEAGEAVAVPDERPARIWHWILADGVSVPPSARRAVETYAESEALDVVDIVPRDLPPEQALRLLTWSSPSGYRSRHFAEPMTSLQAILVEDATLERSGMRETALSGCHDPIAMQQLATALVPAAATSKDIVVANGVRAVAEDPFRRRAYLRTRFGPMLEPLSGLALLAPVVRLAFLAAGLILSPIAGSGALLAWCLQPFLALVGTPLRPRGLWWRSLFRWLVAPVTLVRVFAGPSRPDPDVDPREDLEALRPVYTELLAHGTERFFEQRRSDCPMCGCTLLRVVARTRDLMQRKPGRFVLERCCGCRHVFQNPRLTPEGLDFYYRDFYEGLGREILDALFASELSAYRTRASMLDGLAKPSRWLDVG